MSSEVLFTKRKKTPSFDIFYSSKFPQGNSVMYSCYIQAYLSVGKYKQANIIRGKLLVNVML